MARPRIYEDADELDKRVESYMDWCRMNDEKPTVTGATLHLGFCDKTTLYDYRDRPEFSHSIKRLLLFVENGYETALHGNSVTGSIFALKNMGWKDKTEVDSNVTMGITWNEEKTYEADQETDHSH